MTHQHTDMEPEFTDLGSFKHVRAAAKEHHSNVVKAGKTEQAGTQTIEVPETSGGQPQVIVRRENGIVDSIEFVCPCGQTTTIRFDYGE